MRNAVPPRLADQPSPDSLTPWPAVWAVIAVATVVRLALALAVDPSYGFHRDELLYFAMADHLSPWRMQFPPLIAVLGRASLAVFGSTNVAAARVPAALGGAALTAVVVATARRLGGRLPALVLVAVALLAAPIFVRPAVLFQPVVFDQLWYALTALGLLVAAQDGRDERDGRTGWLMAGTGLGFGALTKFSVAFYGLTFVAAVLATPSLRRQLRTRWPWVASAIAAGLSLPALTGQWVNGWPALAQRHSLGAQLAARGASWGTYLADQPAMLGAAAPLVVLAVWALLRPPVAAKGRFDLRAARPLGVAAGALVLLVGALHGKGYYAGPAYAPLLAVGAVAVERVAARRGGLRRWMMPAVIGAVAAAGAVLLPIGVPLLPLGATARYVARLGLGAATDGPHNPLLRDNADMLGWRAQAAAVAAAWHSLPAAERAHTALFTTNYGRAGALARYGAADGIPYPISRHGDFWAWGPGAPGTTGLLVVGEVPGDLAGDCGALVPVARLRNPLGVDEEQDVPLTLCRGLRVPLEYLWRRGPVWD